MKVGIRNYQTVLLGKNDPLSMFLNCTCLGLTALYRLYCTEKSAAL